MVKAVIFIGMERVHPECKLVGWEEGCALIELVMFVQPDAEPREGKCLGGGVLWLNLEHSKVMFLNGTYFIWGDISK